MIPFLVGLAFGSQSLKTQDWLLFHHNSAKEQAFATKFRALRPGEDRSEFAAQNGMDHYDSPCGVAIYFPTLAHEAERKRKQISLLRELIERSGVWINSKTMSESQKDFVEALVGLHSNAGHYVRACGSLGINLSGVRFSFGSEFERPKDAAVDDIKNLNPYQSPLTARYSLENFQVVSSILQPASRVPRPKLIKELFDFFDSQFKKIDEGLNAELAALMRGKKGLTADESKVLFLSGRPLSEFPTPLRNQLLANYATSSGDASAADPKKAPKALLDSPVIVEDGGFQFEVVPGYDRSIRYRLTIGSIPLK